MSDGALTRDEIDALLAGVDGKRDAHSYCVDVNFTYDNKELEKLTSLLVELSKILPEIITDKFINEVAEKWLKKYLKTHLSRMKEENIKPKRYKKINNSSFPTYIEAMEINKKTELDVRKWAGFDKVYPSPALEPTENNPSGVYWQVKIKHESYDRIDTCISGDFIAKSIGTCWVFFPISRKEFLETYEQEEGL